MNNEILNSIDIKNADEIIEKLESRAGNIPDRTLTRMKTAIEFFNLKPQKIVNIVGTNGKGTVSNAIFQTLKSFGLKVGMYTSPHLVNYTERIVDNDGEIDYSVFLKLVKYVSDHEDEIDCGDFTYFEVITLAAMIYFEMKNEDILVVEAGVGGRTDATKALESSILQVITSISIDHSDYLGDTIYKIAQNKSGIMNGTKTITLNTGDALKALSEEKEKTNTTLYTSSDFEFTVDGKIVEKEMISVSGEFGVKFLAREIKINPKQFGVFRGENYALAFAAIVTILKELKIEYDNDIIVEALNTASWIGRTEVIGREPLTILDGAHNIDAIEKLFKSVSKINHKKLITVFAIMSRKDHEHIAPVVRNNSDILIVTTNNDSKALDPETLKKETSADYSFYNLKDALEKSKELAEKYDTILIFGSLYLVGEILKLIK